MVSSKKKAQLWRKAVIHFSLCFVMGFFTGFMPTAGKTPRSFLADGGVPPEASQTPTELPPANLNRSLAAENQAETRSNTIRESVETLDKEEEQVIRKEEEERRLLIIVTATSGRDGNRGALVRRLGNTLSLVAAPVLWVVVEAREEEAAEGEEVAEMLRKTRVMHRHVVMVRGNATRRRREEEEDEEMEMRNVAVAQLQHHRITGILHFAALHNVYDLHFFQALRDIEVYGSWPVAFLSPNRKRVVIEGPVCKSARVVGWHHHHHHTNPIGQQQLLMTGKKKNQTLSSTSSSPPIRLSNLAFNTSILWDPERWGRAASSQHTTMQNSIEFVKQEILEDEGALRGIPSHDCSKVLLWHLHFLTKTTTYR